MSVHVLGNVCASQDHLTQSFGYHNRALAQYRATVGDKHHRTADLCSKVADHYLRFRKATEAKLLLNQASLIYSSRDHFKQELVRTYALFALLYLLLGGKGKRTEYQAKAMSLYRLLVPHDMRDDEDIGDTDFERIVCFASRWTLMKVP
ncbi:hypothetical protein GJ744_012044 [Endocarpon pusillum]|uniref:Uncharacterized protein n=1 Tax=Endocarpon pusillum TaxID=364733 RepID=A0A8H7ATM3_9EURO|nr:hypothetical protein GJ744_012044 [Endocarpon pusillum]